MKVLVVGGAGYIGSHAVRALKAAGHEPVIFDNLVAGHAEVAQRLEVPFIEADLNHPGEIHRALIDHPVDAVMHFAAFAAVGESVAQPAKYYQNNVVGTIQLLEAMRSQGVRYLVFSSSCATYGVPIRSTLDEGHPQNPISPYGWSKLIVEQMLRDYDGAYGMKHVSLRYFNAAGASGDALLGEDHHPETHLIPLCLQTAIGARDELTIYGTDYDTADGTCVRDYIHVEDLANAHLQAIDYLQAGEESIMLNVGTGRGHSVREVIDCCKEVTGMPIRVIEGERRLGDPPILVATADMIRETLGWKPTYENIEPIVETAWNWFHRGGRYKD